MCTATSRNSYPYNLSRHVPPEIVGIIYSFSNPKDRRALSNTSKPLYSSLYNAECNALIEVTSKVSLSPEGERRFKEITLSTSPEIGRLHFAISLLREDMIPIWAELDSQTRERLGKELGFVADKIDGYFKIAEISSIHDEKSRSNQLFYLCCDFDLEGKHALQFYAANIIPNSDVKTKTLRLLATSLLQKKRINEALKVANTIPVADHKTMTCIDFAGKIGFDDREGAICFLNLAMDTALTISDGEDREAILNEIQDALNKLN